MSGLTPCNYCTLQRIKAEAEKRGATVDCHRPTLKEEAERLGQDIQTNARGEYRTWYVVQESDATEPCATFMELTTSCVC